MQLIIDLGNSNLVLGVWHDESWQHIWRLNTHREDDAHIYYKNQLELLFLDNSLASDSFEQVIVSSVVPELTPVISEVIANLGFRKIKVIGPDLFATLNIQIDNPREIGSDLVANATAAYHQYQAPCIVIDFGTALTFTTVDKAGNIQGVAIAPGLKTAMMSLYGKTSKLPEAPVELPKSAIGKNTIHAIQSGVLWGYVGLVERIITKSEEELKHPLSKIATGGLSKILHPLQDIIDHYEPNLTLNGIRLLGQKINENA